MTADGFSAARRQFCLVTFASLTVLSGCGPRPSSLFTPDRGMTEDRTDGALPLVNALRLKNGLSLLVQDQSAMEAARDQAGQMAKAGVMAHLIGPMANFQRRMEGHKVGLPAAENIAAGQSDVDRAVTAWIESPKHLKNMLGPYGGLGVAVSRNPASDNRPYWAMVLSTVS